MCERQATRSKRISWTVVKNSNNISRNKRIIITIIKNFAEMREGSPSKPKIQALSLVPMFACFSGFR